jgi:hypothetical protein
MENWFIGGLNVVPITMLHICAAITACDQLVFSYIRECIEIFCEDTSMLLKKSY